MKKNVCQQQQKTTTKYISSVVEEMGWAGELRDLVWGEAASQDLLVPTSSSPVHRTWNWQSRAQNHPNLPCKPASTFKNLRQRPESKSNKSEVGKCVEIIPGDRRRRSSRWILRLELEERNNWWMSAMLAIRRWKHDVVQQSTYINRGSQRWSLGLSVHVHVSLSGRTCVLSLV